MPRPKNLSIIIPAYNEQDRIIKTLKEIHDSMPFLDINYEIFVVDDGSTDDTKFKIIKYCSDNMINNVKVLWLPTNKGKGYAVRRGLLRSKYKSKLILDADHSVSCYELITLKSKDWKTEGIVAGKRYQVIKQPLYRWILGKIWQILVWLRTGIYGDTQAPYKFCRLPDEFYRQLKIDGFAYDVELLAKAKSEYSLRWTKVLYYDDKNTKVTIPKVARMFLDLVKLKIK